ncbi:hypothetical protein Bbelb_013830 [Branchiostoma belcheri]|nr:hypothetical protein Bbelb_013830 [Branchiostoma belcheri]
MAQRYHGGPESSDKRTTDFAGDRTQPEIRYRIQYGVRNFIIILSEKTHTVKVITDGLPAEVFSMERSSHAQGGKRETFVPVGRTNLMFAKQSVWVTMAGQTTEQHNSPNPDIRETKPGIGNSIPRPLQSRENSPKTGLEAEEEHRCRLPETTLAPRTDLCPQLKV